MEETKNNKHPETCECPICKMGAGMCFHGYHSGKHWILKIVLAFIVLVLTFWVGFRVGVISTYLTGYRGYPMMYYRSYGPAERWSGNYNGYGPGMMGYFNQAQPQDQNATTTK